MPAKALPDDATTAGALASPKQASSTIPSLEPLRRQIASWHARGHPGIAAVVERTFY